MRPPLATPSRASEACRYEDQIPGLPPSSDVRHAWPTLGEVPVVGDDEYIAFIDLESFDEGGSDSR